MRLRAMLWWSRINKESSMKTQTLYTKLSRRLLGGLCTVLTTAIILAGQVQAAYSLLTRSYRCWYTLLYGSGGGFKGTGIPTLT